MLVKAGVKQGLLNLGVKLRFDRDEREELELKRCAGVLVLR